ESLVRHRADAGGAVSREVRELERRLRIARRDRGDGANPSRITIAVMPRVLHARYDERGGTVAGRADVEEAQRVGDDRRGEHVVDGDLFPVPRVRIVQAMAGVLHLDAREVLAGRAEQFDAAARVETEVRRIRRAEEAETQP